MICGGDFSIRLKPKWANFLWSYDSQNNALSKKMRGILKEMGDEWREFNPTTRDYTFWSTPHASFSGKIYFSYKLRRRITAKTALKVNKLELELKRVLLFATGVFGKSNFRKCHIIVLLRVQLFNMRTSIKSLTNGRVPALITLLKIACILYRPCTYYNPRLTWSNEPTLKNILVSIENNPIVLLEKSILSASWQKEPVENSSKCTDKGL